MKEKEAKKQVCERIRELARTEPDRRIAAATVLRELGTDPQLLTALGSVLYEWAVLSKVDDARAEVREAIRSNPSGRTIEVMTETNRTRFGTMFDVWMIGAQRLGDAGADDLRRAIEQSEQSERGMRVNRLWYSMLLGGLKRGKTVRKSMTEKDAAKLLEKAKEKAG